MQWQTVDTVRCIIYVHRERKCLSLTACLDIVHTYIQSYTDTGLIAITDTSWFVTASKVASLKVKMQRQITQEERWMLDHAAALLSVSVFKHVFTFKSPVIAVRS